MSNAARTVVFRADGGGQIGAGHIMRCLTLANAMSAQGDVCHFLTCSEPGPLLDQVREAQHTVHALTPDQLPDARSDPVLAHASWIGHSQRADSAACADVLAEMRPDWLVLDHYALDQRWQSDLGPLVAHQMSIDDLADRAFISDVHVDPNPLNAKPIAQRVVPPHKGKALVGCEYALLRPEFSVTQKPASSGGDPLDVLIMMGGVDSKDISSQILEWLVGAPELRTSIRKVTVILGAAATISDRLLRAQEALRDIAEIVQNPPNISELMFNADLCIGAAGGSAWERCAMGLPTLTIVTAQNQRGIARYLSDKGAGRTLDSFDRDGFVSAFKAVCETSVLQDLRSNAMRLVDGRGTARVMAAMEDME